MKIILSLFMAALLLVSLCGITAMADDVADICGSYTLINMRNTETEDMEESLRALAKLDMTAELTINPDGSAVLSLFDEEMALNFDFTARTVSVDEEALPYDFDGEILGFGDEDTYFTFSKSGFGETEPKSGGPFRFFVLEDVLDADGKSVIGDYLDDEDDFGIIDDIALYLFEDGSAVFVDLDAVLDMVFDFDTMTVDAGDGDVFPFTLEGTTLTIENNYKDQIILEQADPDPAGPYVMVAMVTPDQGDLADQLELLKTLDMLPTLVMEEDGRAVLDLFDEPMDLLFDFDTMTVSMDGETLPFTYDYGVLRIGEDSAFMSFARVLADGE